MNKGAYVQWREGTHWLGHLQEFPDYLTQGESLEASKITSAISTVIS